MTTRAGHLGAAFLAGTLTVLAGCTNPAGEPEEPAANRLENAVAVASGRPGGRLDSVTVRVGYVGNVWSPPTPVPGRTVVWQVAGGGGSVAPSRSVSDASGIATATWTLGPQLGLQTLTVTLPGIDTLLVQGYVVPDTTLQISFVRSGQFCLLRLADRALRCVPWDGRDGAYSWSPAGDRITFVSSRSGHSELYTMRPDGSEQVRLTTTPGENKASPAWSPDGRWIAFASDSGRIHLVAPDGSSDTTLSRPGAQVSHPTWAPDASRLAVVAEYPNPSGNDDIRQIEILGRDGARTVLTATVDDVVSRDVSLPEWSPSGDVIALWWCESYGTAGWGCRTDFIAPDGTGRRHTSLGQAPSWSPDGTVLAWLGGWCDTFDCEPGYVDLRIGCEGVWQIPLAPGLRPVASPRWRPVPGARR